MASYRTCDGVSRRDFLKVGVVGGLGFSLASYLRLAAAGVVRPTAARGAIFIQLGGGPSHMDSFDLKPDAPAEYRGEFKPIATNVPGVEICEHLPQLARCADKFAILRGVSHSLAAHGPGTQYLLTGNRPTPALEYPGYGAVVSKELTVAADLPPFVAIPATQQTPGYLGVRYAPLQTNAMPTLGKPLPVRGITFGSGLTVTGVEKRVRLLNDVDDAFRGYEETSDVLAGLDQFKDKAYRIISSPRARQAFDLSREPQATAERFGNHGFGQGCLLAGRLIEAGVRFVTVSLGGWDTHGQNFAALKGRDNGGKGGKGSQGLLPQLDSGLSGLLTWLDQRGLLASTVIFVTGEFGRTPKINKNAGRDHWSRAMFVLMAGGGIRGGQVVGASDARAEGPKGGGYKPDDVAASFYHSLGIDPAKEYHTSIGRPVMLVREGKPIRHLFAT
jgi:uncharacterized protein (DUF1501 family)